MVEYRGKLLALLHKNMVTFHPAAESSVFLWSCHSALCTWSMHPHIPIFSCPLISYQSAQCIQASAENWAVISLRSSHLTEVKDQTPERIKVSSAAELLNSDFPLFSSFHILHNLIKLWLNSSFLSRVRVKTQTRWRQVLAQDLEIVKKDICSCPHTHPSGKPGSLLLSLDLALKEISQMPTAEQNHFPLAITL